MEQIKIFCPATVANLNCGFDVLGLCMDNIGDEMIIKKSSQKGIRITHISGAKIPYETKKNVAGVAALAVIENLSIDHGFEIEIHKKIKAGSGIGSSAASAAGTVYGLNQLLGNPFTENELVSFAMKGEAIASGSEHADNVAPCLLGGITLVRGYDPLDIIKIPVPEELYIVVLHPDIEVKTSDARAVIQPKIDLKSAITQWGNLAGLISGFYSNDYSLISRSLNDVIVEPLRKHLIPNFEELKEQALFTGALGAGISGAGPSVFALCQGKMTAENVAVAMTKTYLKTRIPFDIHLSKINTKGTQFY